MKLDISEEVDLEKSSFCIFCSKKYVELSNGAKIIRINGEIR